MATWENRFVQAFGDAAKRSGVMSEMSGRIFGTLYVMTDSLSLDEICERLGASKGNVSIQVRELLMLGMVRKVTMPGSRRHHYEAVTDLWAIASEVIGQRLEREAETLLRDIQRIEPQLDKGVAREVKARMSSMSTFLQLMVGMIEGVRRGDLPGPAALSGRARE